MMNHCQKKNTQQKYRNVQNNYNKFYDRKFLLIFSIFFLKNNKIDLIILRIIKNMKKINFFNNYSYQYLIKR